LSVIDYLVLDTIKRTSCQYLNLARIKGMRKHMWNGIGFYSEQKAKTW
jgi:hypothetical protein